MGGDSRTLSRHLRTTEAADYTGLSVRTLENLRQRGGGPRYRKLGTSRRAPVVYSVASLQAWLDSFSEVDNTGQAGGAA